MFYQNYHSYCKKFRIEIEYLKATIYNKMLCSVQIGMEAAYEGIGLYKNRWQNPPGSQGEGLVAG